MASINQEITKLLDSDLAVQKDLDRGIINVRGLAKFIIDKYKLSASLDAVINAIRRYESNVKFQEEEVKSLFKGSNVFTRNHIACITLKLDAYKELSKLFMLMNPSMTDRFRIATGPNSIKLIVGKDNLETVLPFFQEETILKIEENLSEISVSVNAKAIQTKGVLARIANEVSVNNINIVEIIIAPPDFLIYVKEEDIVKTHETLLKISG